MTCCGKIRSRRCHPAIGPRGALRRDARARTWSDRRRRRRRPPSHRRLPRSRSRCSSSSRSCSRKCSISSSRSSSVILQALGNQHREKMDLLHQELDSLRSLTKELSELRVEIASRERAGNKSSGRSRAALGAGEVAEPSRASSAQDQRTSSSVANGNTNGSAGATGSGSPNAIPGTLPVPPAPALQPAPAPDDSATSPADPEVHAWLCDRFHTLEKERQNSWQRILGMILGSTGGSIT